MAKRRCRASPPNAQSGSATPAVPNAARNPDSPNAVVPSAARSLDSRDVTSRGSERKRRDPTPPHRRQAEGPRGAGEPSEEALPSPRPHRSRGSRAGGARQPSGHQASGRPGCISRVAGRQHVTHLLAAQGIGAASRLPRLLASGRVTVNGRPVRDTDARADPRRDVVAIDGEPVTFTNLCRYLVAHKPYRVMCSFTDPEGRATLADYVPVPDVYAAGRLDYDSEGLVLLTNDGWLLHRLTHPRYEHPKTYLVQVERVPEKTLPAEVELLRGDERPNVPPRSVPIRYRANVPTAWLRMTLREGRKRQVRHMTAAVGYPTLRLIRVSSGPIALGDLAPGAAALSRALHPPREGSSSGPRRPPPRGASHGARKPRR